MLSLPTLIIKYPNYKIIFANGGDRNNKTTPESLFCEKNKVETLWKIVLSDGEVHEFESNLIRRLAGLLYISDVSCGNAKNRAINSS